MGALSRQEIFDKVVFALRKQARPSTRAMERCKCCITLVCAYRGDDGLKCAAGHLIEDHEYGPWMEGGGGGMDFSGILGNPLCPPSLKARLSEHRDFICELQEIHDAGSVREDKRPLPYWETRWKNLARFHGLIYTAP